jgi:hypothetical protein
MSVTNYLSAAALAAIDEEFTALTRKETRLDFAHSILRRAQPRGAALIGRCHNRGRDRAQEHQVWPREIWNLPSEIRRQNG